jgi:cytidyltransferase-like protein
LTWGFPGIVKTGCFDILHIAHIRLFEHLKKKYGKLIVFVGSDDVITTLKGKLPYFDENIRAESVAAIQWVDYVIILKEVSHYDLLRIVAPIYYHVPSSEKYMADKAKWTNQLSIELVVEDEIIISNFGIPMEVHSQKIKDHD